MNNKKTYGNFLAVQTERKYHMSPKKLLKKLLNVNCIKIINASFEVTSQSLYIHVKATKGKQKRCPICGRKCTGYDATTKCRKWRHLDFGSCAVFIVADVHRVECPEHGVHTEMVPWANHHSSYTKEFEQQVAYLALRLNKKEVSKLMRISWNTVGPVLSRTKNIYEPDSSVRFKNLIRIGIDETSYKKGHKYVTVVTDHDTNQVIWVGEGTGKVVLEKFFKLLTAEQRNRITLVSADGARWIKSCIDEYCPNAERCIDGFHVVSWAIDAMDTLRKEIWHNSLKCDRSQSKRGRGRPKKGEKVVKKAPSIKDAKYPLGKNPENLTPYQKNKLDEIKHLYPILFRGYQLKEGLRFVFQCGKENVEHELNKWLAWACRCRIPVFVELSKKIRRHKEAIIATVHHGLSNARIESMNNKIKVMIRKAYGFRNIQNLIDMIMIVCSDLYKKIELPYEIRQSMFIQFD